MAAGKFLAMTGLNSVLFGISVLILVYHDLFGGNSRSIFRMGLDLETLFYLDITRLVLLKMS